VQKLFAANERGGGKDFRAVGVLADYAEVEERHEAAVEQYLRDELEYVVVENPTTTPAPAFPCSAMKWAAGPLSLWTRSGTCVFPPNTNQSLTSGGRRRHLAAGQIGGIPRSARCRGETIPARLRSAYLTESTAAAEKLARENSQYAFVTPDGTCYQGRMVTGGRPDEVGPLGMKRELRALDAEVMQLEHEMSQKQAALETMAGELRSTEQALTEIEREAARSGTRSNFRHASPWADAKRTRPPRAGTHRLPERTRACPQGSGKRAAARRARGRTSMPPPR